MMTSFDVFTELWNWHSPAWWIAVAAAAVYLVVVRRRRPSVGQIVFFAAAVVAFLIALASPVAALARQYLFSAHMAQHLLLLLIVPMFAILGWPARPAEAAAQRRSRPAAAAVPIGWMAGVGAMWFWHIPALCTASMRSPLVFAVQIVSLIAAGAAFWWPVFSPVVQRRMQPHLAVGYLFAGCLGCTLLGIYVTFSPISVCPLYCHPTGSADVINLIDQQWGFTPRIDQQIGGLLMWVPACLIYLSAIIASLRSWYLDPYQTGSPSISSATE